MAGSNTYNPSLPSILCLHGGGTNSTIFTIQLIRLTRQLKNSFNFIFLDALIESEPGPEVIPFFEGCGPFLRWYQPNGSNSSNSKSKEDLHEDVQLMIHEAAAKYNFVGVLGFSQGAKLAAGLLLEQQVAEREAGDRARTSFKFGVFFNGTSPPLTTAKLKDNLVEKGGELIRIPGLHVLGLQDRWREESRRLFEENFEKKSNRLIEFDIGHRLPVLEADTKQIADEMLRLYKNSLVVSWNARGVEPVGNTNRNMDEN